MTDILSSPELVYNPFQAIDEVQSSALNPKQDDASEFVTLSISGDEENLSQKIGQGKIGQEKTLKQREEELARRERELERREKIMDVKLSPQLTPANQKAANWPHKKAAFVYHDIGAEIPENMQFLIKMAYLCWQLTSVGLVLNTVAVLHAAWSNKYYGDSSHSTNFYAILYMVAGIPLSFVLWYFNLYRVAIESKTSSWMVFFVSFVVHMIFCLFILSGTPTHPCGGIFFTIDLFMYGYYRSAIMGIVNTCVWIVVTVYSFGIMTTAKRLYMTQGGKEQTEEDLKSGVKGISASAFKMHAIATAMSGQQQTATTSV